MRDGALARRLTISAPSRSTTAAAYIPMTRRAIPDDAPEIDWSCDEETARGSLPDNVSVIGSRKVIVQRPAKEIWPATNLTAPAARARAYASTPTAGADGSAGRGSEGRINLSVILTAAAMRSYLHAAVVLFGQLSQHCIH